MPPVTYTPPGGNTPASTQLNTTNQQLLASASNTINSGQTLTPDVANAAQNAYATTNQDLQSTQTPQARQGYLDNTNINAVQGNIDSLAKQLAQYDQAVLQPQFQGTNPGPATDMPVNPLGYTPNISYLTPNTPTGTYNANPAYGLSAQADQGNSIVNLLGLLNKTLSNESARGTNKYTSDLKSLASMLGPLGDILNQNTQLTMKKAELSQSLSDKASTKQQNDENKLFTFAQQIKDDFQAGKYSMGNPQLAWGKAWQELSTLRNQIAPSVNDDELNAFLGGAATFNPTTKTWTGTGNAAPDVLQSLGLVASKSLPAAPPSSPLSGIGNFFGSLLGGNKTTQSAPNGKIHIQGPDGSTGYANQADVPALIQAGGKVIP